MRFKNPKTEEIYDLDKQNCVTSGFCKSFLCNECPIKYYINPGSLPLPCKTWVNAHPEEAARLMGYKLIKEEGESNMENYIVINGKKAELTPEQLEKLGIVVKENPFERKEGKYYYCTTHTRDGVIESIDTMDDIDLERYNVANYCSNKQMMEQRALYETLSRLLWRYSMQHDGDKIDWNDHNQSKWFIYFNHETKKFDINYFIRNNYGVVYFHKYETANSAITEIIEPFMKEHPDFVW